jgi:glucan phosphoethanolaminetransferase (alkaline phosphatase superfamily)
MRIEGKVRRKFIRIRDTFYVGETMALIGPWELLICTIWILIWIIPWRLRVKRTRALTMLQILLMIIVMIIIGIIAYHFQEPTLRSRAGSLKPLFIIIIFIKLPH